MKKILWCCIALFFARVVGQIEVWLVAPNWLPEASAWYSGLLPYPILLPTQIAMLMLMSVVAMRARVASARVRIGVALIALVYFIRHGGETGADRLGARATLLYAWSDTRGLPLDSGPLSPGARTGDRYGRIAARVTAGARPAEPSA